VNYKVNDVRATLEEYTTFVLTNIIMTSIEEIPPKSDKEFIWILRNYFTDKLINIIFPFLIKSVEGDSVK
jgi:hypothetical protein